MTVTICIHCKGPWPCPNRRSHGPDGIHYPARISVWSWLWQRVQKALKRMTHRDISRGLRRIDWRGVLLMAGLVAASCLAGACAAWLVLDFWGCRL